MERSLINNLSPQIVNILCSGSYPVKLVKPVFKQDNHGWNHIGAELIGEGNVENRYHIYWDCAEIHSSVVGKAISSFWLEQEDENYTTQKGKALLPGNSACVGKSHNHGLYIFATIIQTSNWFFDTWLTQNSVTKEETERLWSLRGDFSKMLHDHDTASESQKKNGDIAYTVGENKEVKKVAGIINFANAGDVFKNKNDKEFYILSVLYQNPDGSYVVWGITDKNAVINLADKDGKPLLIDIETSYKFFKHQPVESSEGLKLSISGTGFGCTAGTSNHFGGLAKIELNGIAGENTNVRTYGVSENKIALEQLSNILGRLPIKGIDVLPEGSHFLFLPENLEDLNSSWISGTYDSALKYINNCKVRIIHRVPIGANKGKMYNTVREFPLCEIARAKQILDELTVFKEVGKKGKQAPSFEKSYLDFLRLAIFGRNPKAPLSFRWHYSQLVNDLFCDNQLNFERYFWDFFLSYIKSHTLNELEDRKPIFKAMGILESLIKLNNLNKENAPVTNFAPIDAIVISALGFKTDDIRLFYKKDNIAQPNQILKKIRSNLASIGNSLTGDKLNSHIRGLYAGAVLSDVEYELGKVMNYKVDRGLAPHQITGRNFSAVFKQAFGKLASANDFKYKLYQHVLSFEVESSNHSFNTGFCCGY